MNPEPRPLDHLRRSVEILVREREAAHKAFDSGQADLELLSAALDAANGHLQQVEQAHASRLAESHARKDAEVETALSEAKAALDDARRSVWTAQADRDQAARALEILRSELAEAQVRLAEGATRAKQAAAGELLEHAKVAWGTVRAVVDEVEATRLIEHGQDPPEIARIVDGAGRFEREVLEGKPPRSAPAAGPAGKARGKTGPGSMGTAAPVAPTPPLDRAAVALRGAVTVAGAAGLVVGSLLAWLRPFAASALDLPFQALYRSNAFESTRSGQLSAGAVMIVLAGVALVGVIPRVRLLAPLAGATGAIAVIAYLSAVGGSTDVGFPSDVGVGAWLALAGGAVLVGAGFVRVRQARSPGLPGPEAAPGAGTAPAAPAPEQTAGRGRGQAPVTAPAAAVTEPGPARPPLQPPAEQPTRREAVAWLAAGAAVVLLVAAVAVRNAQPEPADVFFWNASIRLVWAVPVLVILGAVLGWALAHPHGILASLRRSEGGMGAPTIGAAIVAVLLLLLLVVAIQNTRAVEIDLLFTTFDVALAWVVVGSLVVGGVVGALAARRGARASRPASICH